VHLWCGVVGVEQRMFCLYTSPPVFGNMVTSMHIVVLCIGRLKKATMYRLLNQVKNTISVSLVSITNWHLFCKQCF
jgi:hypothetical protein